MIRLFINGVAASAGGGLTYLRNVIPHLARRGDTETTVLLNPGLGEEFGSLPNVSLVSSSMSSGTFRRFIQEQTTIPDLIRSSGAKVLLSTGNFSLWNCPVPQILLSRNSLYTSRDFSRDLRSREDYFLWADTLIKGRMARRSIRRAEITIAPSAAFAEELSRWSGREVMSLHHGFDANSFARRSEPLPASAEAELEQANDALRLLFVSHYNYYRNFETLFRALPLLRQGLKGKAVKLFLTCRLRSGENPGVYRAEKASSLLRDLQSEGCVVQLGAIPYRSLHQLYSACHIYVTPAYAESFAHPLVEAMSCGLPLVASDLPVHREICQDAAVYFPRFSPEALAERVLQVHDSSELADQLSGNGLHRALGFSWSKHVELLVVLAQDLIRRGGERN